MARSIHADLLSAQKDSSFNVKVKIVLTYSAITHTYEEDRILSINHQESPESQTAEVVLDDSDNVLSALDLKGYKGVISYGLTDANGTNRYSAAAPLLVKGQLGHSSQGVLASTLSLHGLPDRLANDKASEAFTMEADDTRTVKDLITAVLNATLTAYSHTVNITATFDSEDDLIDSVTPRDSFRVNFNESRLEALKRLLEYTKCVMRAEDDGEVHIFVPTTSGTEWVASTAYTVNDYVQPTTPNNNFTYKCTVAGTSHSSEPTWPTTAGGTVVDNTVTWTAVAHDYTYELAASGEHTFFSKVHRKRLVLPNYVSIKSHPDHPDSYAGTAEDTASSDLTPPTPFSSAEIRDHQYMRLDSNAQATAIAEAQLTKHQQDAEAGSGLVPMNVGTEAYDYVKITDSRQNDDIRIANIGYLERIYMPGTYELRFGFGTIRAGGYEGLLPPAVVGLMGATGATGRGGATGIVSVTGGVTMEILRKLAMDIEAALNTAARERDWLANAVRLNSFLINQMSVVSSPGPLGRVMQAVSDFNDLKDQLLEFDNWKCFIYFLRNTASGAWSTPTNAVYTVPTGKKLVCVFLWPYHGLIDDPTNRQARFRNTTDSTDVFAPASFQSEGFVLTWALVGDLAGPATFTEVVAGKTVKLELWNNTGGNRAMGVVMICKEMEA
ncbi:hypothetical protein LCGC14_0386160 [marine sediment metagenome]|uniref:Uncharacterized protein n=1 Tax=marine sediment metagenome TaxID=412755 RepID=A0A0F9TJ17_9ZZZZ